MRAARSAPKFEDRTLNMSDVPEMMPGARPGANPTERSHFEEACKKLWRAETKERKAAARRQNTRVSLNAAERFSQLEAMFPDVDTALIHALCSEGRSTEEVVGTLVTLCAPMTEAVDDRLAPQSLSVRLEDEGRWPVLVDSAGWQVMNPRQMNEAEEAGSDWCKRAKEVARLPTGKSAPRPDIQSRRRKELCPKEEVHFEESSPLTDYDFRQEKGAQRAKRLARKAEERFTKVVPQYSIPGDHECVCDVPPSSDSEAAGER